MKKYFQLFEECILVYNSADEGAIYNLLSGDVFQYNIFETNILTLCEKKNSIQQVIKLLNASNESVYSFLDKLATANLGFYSDKSVYIEKMLIDYNWRELSFLKDRPVIERAYILLDKVCDCNCIYCDENHIRLNSCVGCFKNVNILGGETTVEEYLMTLDKLKLLGTNTVFFSGGNFFENFYKKIKIVKYAKEIFIKNIVLFLGCNQTVKKEYLKELKQIDIDICIQVPI
ncbi:MAG: radical SAM protein, partial [Lachnospiraceae bacterium]|nr:radical SAM protein [Lachnospiraceae bacterium]